MAQNNRLSLAQRTRTAVALRNTTKIVPSDENVAPKSALAGGAQRVRVPLGQKQADATAGVAKQAVRRALNDVSNKEKVPRNVDGGKKDKENVKEPAAAPAPTLTRMRSSTLTGTGRVPLRQATAPAPINAAPAATRSSRSASVSSTAPTVVEFDPSSALPPPPKGSSNALVSLYVDEVQIVLDDEYIESIGRDEDADADMDEDMMELDDEPVATAEIVISTSNPMLPAIPDEAESTTPLPSSEGGESEEARERDIVARQLSPTAFTHEPEEEDADEDVSAEDWVTLPSKEWAKVQGELERVRKTVEDEVDPYDTTMVAEYADEIFEYMSELEASSMPSPTYMTSQTELEWSMRTTLVDWLLQVHLRYHMLPETLWIAVNVVDRFLSARVVSLVKLQLVGVTAMFIAAKYEEILAPSVEEFVFMTENGYTKDEILKGERIILQTLDFKISNYCSPYSWVRRISKADDYDIHTRTLCKFIMEVTLLDERFLRARPSMIAAVGMYVARRMLSGDWNDQFIFYSSYTEQQLIPGAKFIVERLCAAEFETYYVCKKYANKRFLKASVFAREWARKHGAELSSQDGLVGLGLGNVGPVTQTIEQASS